LQCALKKPHAQMFGKKNDINPFVDASPLEFFSQKNDSSLFVFGAHQKKRPNHLVLGRMFEHRLMDMIELGIKQYVPAQQFKVRF
jgi:ribosome production factor 2